MVPVIAASPSTAKASVVGATEKPSLPCSEAVGALDVVAVLLPNAPVSVALLYLILKV